MPGEVNVPEEAVEAVAAAHHERNRQHFDSDEAPQWAGPWSELDETNRQGVLAALRRDKRLTQILTDALPAIRTSTGADESR